MIPTKMIATQTMRAYKKALRITVWVNRIRSLVAQTQFRVKDSFRSDLYDNESCVRLKDRVCGPQSTHEPDFSGRKK